MAGGGKVTEAAWEAAGCALAADRPPPVWIDFLIEAHRRLQVGDLRSAIVNGAIASETVIRSSFSATLPQIVSPVAVRILDVTPVQGLLSRWEEISGWDKEGEGQREEPGSRAVRPPEHRLAQRSKRSRGLGSYPHAPAARDSVRPGGRRRRIGARVLPNTSAAGRPCDRTPNYGGHLNGGDRVRHFGETLVRSVLHTRSHARARDERRAVIPLCSPEGDRPLPASLANTIVAAFPNDRLRSGPSANHHKRSKPCWGRPQWCDGMEHILRAIGVASGI